MRRLGILGFGLVVAIVMALGACSSGKSDEAAPEPAQISEAAPDSPMASEATAPSDCADVTADNPFTITIKDFAFEPSCVTAKGSSSITVVNEDSTDHTFTIEGTQVDVPIAAGETFNGESAGLAPGTYTFVCTIHPTMTGTINVT